MCCVNRLLLKKSSIQSVLDHLDARANQPGSFDENELQNAVKVVCAKAYGDESTTTDIISGSNIPNCCRTLYNVYGWRQKYFILGLYEVAEFAESGMLISLLSELCRTSSLCLAGQRFGFMGLMEVVKSRMKVDDSGDVLEEFLERYVNEYVSKAFRTAMMEPTWAYFIGTDPTSCYGEIAEQHCLNYYAALCVAITGIPVTIPHLGDEYPYGGAAKFLECKEENYLKWIEAAKNPENFGKNFAAIPEFKDVRGKITKRVDQEFYFKNSRTTLERVQNAIGDEEKNADERKKVADYMEFFMYFFSKEFFIPKFMNALSQYVPTATQTAFEELKATDQTIEEDDFRFWIWDSLDGKLNADRAEKLLRFCEIIN
eukprot:TRINITY_DN7226_c1_g1_i2.p1 TRINITY_DN7226_c1_g1~~TRINITY_DN7226_c1_g1_i2.p1  ORF type:complete len:434 (+),score=107.44 TRINITY_DN7226_c1_g1_i2:189-1304(+)